MQLDFKVEEQNLHLVSLKKVVADSVDYLTCKFTFSEDWNGVTKSATFFPANGEPYTQTLEDDGCVVPHEVIKYPLFKVSVFGGDLITTNKVIVNVIESGYVLGQTPKPPTPDVYNQILNKLNNNTDNGIQNAIGITKELGVFECTAIDESTNKYTFDVPDTSEFVPSTEYKVTIDDVEYLVRTSTINSDNGVLVGVDGAVPFEVGNTYAIVFETSNAVSFGKKNTVLAHNGFATGCRNTIDETGDQSATFGYGHEVSGKNQMVTGYNHDILGGEGNFVSGSGNVVDGRNKLVSGAGLTSILSANGAAVLGNHNIDVENAIFVIGGGADKNQKKNLLVMDKYGNTILNGKLDINGDITLNGEPIAVIKNGTGTNSTVLGSTKTNSATGLNSLVSGSSNEVTNDQGVAFGYDNENHAKNAFVMGLYNIIEAAAQGSVALGNKIHIYTVGAGIGNNLTVKKTSGNQVVVGKYNKEDNKALFIVGNGKNGALNNAFIIYDDGSAKFAGNVDINGTLSTVQINANYLTAKFQVNTQTVNASESVSTKNLYASGSVNAKGKVTGSNIFPITKTFVANGNVTNADTGEVVAKYSNGSVSFNIVEVSYGSGYDGAMIKNNKNLVVPIAPITLKAGTYKKEIPCPYDFRLDECNFKVSWIDGNTENVIDKDDYYVVTKDIVVDTIYLKTDIADSELPYNGTYRFNGEGVLSFNAIMVTDITADLIGATNEYIEPDGVSTSLHLTSPNGTVFKLTVDDNGTLTTTKV